jgi:hypothetical protein
MANLTSTLISNGSARPSVLNSANAGAPGAVQNTYAAVSVTTGEVSTNVLRIVRVPSNARAISVRASSTPLGGTCAGDIGLYRIAEEGGAVVDADFFGSAVSFVAANNATEQLAESAVNTPILQGQPLWQAAGLAADPRTYFDVAVTLTANVSSAGSLGLSVSYVQ